MVESQMKHIALIAASTLFSVAGIGAALADDPYPVRSQDEAIAVEHHRANGFNAMQPDPFYYGNNPGTRANAAPSVEGEAIYDDGHAEAYDPDRADADAYERGRADADAEAYERGRADQESRDYDSGVP